MSELNIDIIRERVSRRLEELAITSFEAARRGGLGRDYVNDILNGRKKSVRTEGLVKLANALNCDVSWLVGDTEKQMRAFSEPHELVYIEGEAAAGIWKEHSIATVGLDYPDRPASPLPPHPRHLASEQFDLVVADDHLNRFAKQNQILRCIKASAWSYDPDDMLLSVIRRVRAGLAETTVRRLSTDWRTENKVYEFYSNDSKYSLELHIDRLDGDELTILGHVLFVYGLPQRYA